MTEKLLENATRQKRALMQQLLTGKRRFPEFEGTEWRQVKLGDLGETYPGLSGKTKEEFGEGDGSYITYMSIFQASKIDVSLLDRVVVGSKEKQNLVRYGDIFFTTSSETPNEVGMSSVLLSQLHHTYLNSFCFGFRPHSFEELEPRFGRFLFRGQDLRRGLHRLAQGATRYNLSKKQFLKLELRIPPLNEQLSIAEVLENSEDQLDKLKLRLEKLRLEKKALMQQLLTGKKRVKV